MTEMTGRQEDTKTSGKVRKERMVSGGQVLDASITNRFFIYVHIRRFVVLHFGVAHPQTGRSK